MTFCCLWFSNFKFSVAAVIKQDWWNKDSAGQHVVNITSLFHPHLVLWQQRQKNMEMRTTVEFKKLMSRIVNAAWGLPHFSSPLFIWIQRNDADACVRTKSETRKNAECYFWEINLHPLEQVHLDRSPAVLTQSRLFWGLSSFRRFNPELTVNGDDVLDYTIARDVLNILTTSSM